MQEDPERLDRLVEALRAAALEPKEPERVSTLSGTSRSTQRTTPNRKETVMVSGVVQALRDELKERTDKLESLEQEWAEGVFARG